MANYMSRQKKTAETNKRKNDLTNCAMKKAKIEAVECLHCKKLHRINSTEYLVFLGNVNIGNKGGLVGDNLDEYLRVIKSSILCRSERCVVQHLVDDRPRPKAVASEPKIEAKKCPDCGERFYDCGCDDQDE